MDFSWTVPTGTYDTFFITYSGIVSVPYQPTITDSVTYTGSNWIFNSDGSIVPTSVSGGYITFTDTRHESYFIPSTAVSFMISGSLLGNPGSISSTGTIVPGTTSTLVYPAAPGMYILTNGAGSPPYTFNWIDDYLPSGTLNGYQFQLYHNSTGTGTQVNITGGAGSMQTTLGVLGYYMPENVNGYVISTSHASPVYGKARAIFTFNGTQYAGPWGNASY